ncbi:MAG TPA: CHAP domain-containing protein [Candidatus Saccharimonadales bacterium]|nr:CHAP domain-containing protein [Candidatus Saccharimonadales bacterium]
MTTEGSRHKIVSLIAVAGLVLGFLGAPVSRAAANCSSLLATDNSKLTYSQLLDKQTCVQQALTQNQKNLAATQKQASDLQSAIHNLDGSISQTQNQISNTQDQIGTTNSIIDSLTGQIAANQAKLDDLNAKLKGAYVNLYELSQTSTVEMIIQSKSIDDLLNQSQYIESIQTDLQNSIGTANSLAADLTGQKQQSEQQKAGLQNLNNQLTQSKASLDGQKAQKNYLLNQTQGDQARYAALLNNLKSEVTKISSDLYAKRQQLGGFLGSGGNGGYPHANSAPDQPDEHGFLTRECTSYAAFAFQRNFGRPFNNTRPGSGSAYNWNNLAADQGYHVSGSAQPGDIVRWDAGPLTSQWGHVAAVEVVYSPTDIVVSEYNWIRYAYDERRINPNDFGGHSYIRP